MRKLTLVTLNLMVILTFTVTGVSEEVNVPDPNLEEASREERNKPKGPITEKDSAELTKNLAANITLAVLNETALSFEQRIALLKRLTKSAPFNIQYMTMEEKSISVIVAIFGSLLKGTNMYFYTQRSVEGRNGNYHLQKFDEVDIIGHCRVDSIQILPDDEDVLRHLLLTTAVSATIRWDQFFTLRLEGYKWKKVGNF